jgi:hypothetical protein
MEWQGFHNTNFGGNFHVHFNHLGYRKFGWGSPPISFEHRSLWHTLTSQLKHVVADHILLLLLRVWTMKKVLGK